MTDQVRSLDDLEYPIDDTAAIKAEHEQLGVAQGDAMALCLSGGGIRSATFGLGVLQGLARCCPRLPKAQVFIHALPGQR